MVTYKVLLDARRPKSDGTYAVTIRITHDRKSTTFNTGVFVKKEQWLLEKCSISNVHPNAGLLNKTVTETYLRVQKSVLELESNGEGV
ncbi:Arm DNA-binding domain-containing protein [Mucilaginibacter ginsenosidivorans]|uniref:Arm DNA-binding domain-containing protein n=1 Tax=Mucilaginibacter ginsenosidivorans TaxID=398053 RepID=A0A5B8UT28_9SPHI|nr:Arm DNA-binding domain-containing protein [Mucilaginibacter ginsenosidivorans]QEC62154.1 hypothetical protein FRZ54_06005 [Mucilaginibacter ginsenosidivorans]